MRRYWLVSLALLLALAGLLSGIGDGALWDPHEVEVAELSRRIGLNLLHGRELFIAGADNSVPIRGDLGRGELPFTSIAVGFRLFGLSEWAGRLPLALWSLAGAAALCAGLARLLDGRAALYGALVLATTPLYFLQARLLLGDAATLGSFAMAWSGLTTALFAPGLSRRACVGFGALGLLGLYAGFWCRGPIVSVAIPALSVALGARFVETSSAPRRAFALAVGAVGALSLVLGVLALWLATQTGDYSVLVGSALPAARELVTFDVALGRLAHAAFPWSALAPLPLALLSATETRPSPERALIFSGSLSVGGCLVAGAWLGLPWATAALPAIACFAALVSAALVAVEDERLTGPQLGMSVAALAALIGLDLRQHPDKSLVGLGLPDLLLPESLQRGAGWLWAGGGACVAVAAVLCLLEPSSEPGRAPAFRRAEYAGVLAVLQRTWRGNLVFAALLLEAALVGFLLLAAVSEKVVRLPQLDSFGTLSRRLAALAAMALPLSALLPLGALALRDAARALFRPRARHAVTRAQGLLLVGAVLGGVASLGFFPSVSRQVAPKHLVDRYRELARPGELLGMLGSGSAAARYRGARDAVGFEDARAAFEWLEASGGARRFLALPSRDLPELNAAFRALHGENLPILDARSSEVFLASSARRPAERDEGPLSTLVLSREPRPDHPLRATLGRELSVLGWSLRSATGEPLRAVSVGQAAQLVVYYQVLAPLRGSWRTFVHLDGLQRRFNADHEPLHDKYPPRYWQRGDILADVTELQLEPYFSPGPYRLYFGLFSGEQRLPVTNGAHSEDRVEAGTLHVR